MASNGQLPPSDLAPIAQGQLATAPAAAWNAMNMEARRRGLELVPTGSASSYRTFAQQEQLYAAYLNGTGALAAVPGTSNHGWGTAVDTPDQRYWDMIQQIGAAFGYQKQWSDAQSEPWHVVYQPGHYSGPDPGPYGAAVAPDLAVLGAAAVVSASGALHTFAEMADGAIFYTWQDPGETAWYGGSAGKQIAGLRPFCPPPG
jgi:hypothetical protein